MANFYVDISSSAWLAFISRRPEGNFFSGTQLPFRETSMSTSLRQLDWASIFVANRAKHLKHWFYVDKEDEACGENSAEKRAVELPANEQSKKPRGSRGNGKRVVLVANADTLLTHQTEYDGADDQSKRPSKPISGGANSKNGSRRSRVAPEENFEEQNPQHFQQLHPQPPKGSHQRQSSVLSDDRDANKMVDNLSSKSRVKEKVEPAKLEEKLGQQNSENSIPSSPQPKGKHGLDLMEPHQKIENSGNQKTQKEHSSRLLLRIRMHCNCEGCAKTMKGIFKRFKGVGSVKIHTDKNLVGVTGTMDTDKLVIYLEEKLRRNVEVIPIQNDENGACPTQKHGAGVCHIANITDNASRKTGVYPNVQETQNLEKTELTLPQPRKGDRNGNEVTGMVHLKIRMHCLEGCIPQTQKTASEFTGVRSVKVDASKHLVIVVGTINVEELVTYLNKKLKRNVEVVHVQNDSLPRDNREVEVTKIETLKEPTASREDGWHNDVEIKNKVKKKAVEIKNKQKVKDVKVEGKKYSLNDGGYDGTEEDKEDKKGNEGVEDNVKEAKEHGYMSHDGEKHKELEREGDRQPYFQNYGKQDDLRYGPSNSDYVPVCHGSGIQMFSDENPNSCAIL